MPVGTVRGVPLPAASTCAKLPIQACVSLLTTGTETAAPTAALPPPLMLPAITFRRHRLVGGDADAAAGADDLAVGEAGAVGDEAFVVTLITGTAAWTLTDAVPPKPPPTEISLKVSSRSRRP